MTLPVLQEGFFIAMEIIDLSQEIYSGMPVHFSQPNVHISVYATHEQLNGEPMDKWSTPAVNRLEISEHTGSHVDAISHMGKKFSNISIDRMPLSMFITRGICLDLSHKLAGESITKKDLMNALGSLQILKGDTVLIHTDHYRKHFLTDQWPNHAGLDEEAVIWLGVQKIAAFGVESMAPGLRGKTNQAVHHICGEMGFTHYENLINLHQLINRGPFQFIGLPLKIKGGTGSPVRAVAVFN